MLRQPPQQNRQEPLLPALMAAVLCILPWIGEDPFKVNYTGLFSSRPLLTWLCMGPALLCLSCLFVCAALKRFPKQTAYRISGLLLLNVLGVMLVRYQNESGLSANIHLLLAYALLIHINLVLYKILEGRPRLLAFYACGCLTAFFFALLASSINGISEIVYGLTLILTLYRFLSKQQ